VIFNYQMVIDNFRRVGTCVPFQSLEDVGIGMQFKF
jgi:hypothetical protein